MKPAISVENLGKCYRVTHRTARKGYRTLRESIAGLATAPFRRLGSHDDGAEDFWALRDVTFEVNPGEVVGIIGRNGAGKSTLLKVLSRITKPSTGKVQLHGRIGSLLEVGTGFHPELTGRENIYLNGSILGMRRGEIDRHFDAIVDFAGVEQFLDTPVKRFSSGMYVRLAFAVAAHLDPEIMVIDEVLAVGDGDFQRKCMAKMNEVARSGRTIIFVSHNMAAVQNLCTRAVVLSGGEAVVNGPVDAAIQRYTELNSTTNQSGDVDLTIHPARRGGCEPIFRRVRLIDGAGNSTSVFHSGASMHIEFTLEPTSALLAPEIGVGVDDAMGTRLFSVATYLSDSELPAIRSKAVVRCNICSLALVPGRYTLSLSAGVNDDTLMDALDNAINFEVEAADFFRNGRLPSPGLGKTLVRSEWQMVPRN